MYEQIWRAKWLADDCKTLEEIALRLEGEAQYLREMDKDGITLRDKVKDDYAFFVTDDPTVAEKHNLYELEEEEW